MSDVVEVGSPPLPAGEGSAVRVETVTVSPLVGSYGRVEASALTTGGAKGDTTSFVAHPGRLDEDPYLELDLGWRLTTPDGARFDVLVTPALAGDLFHYSGQFDASLALRNLYADASGFGAPGLSVWAGSRMYRGDDVYLLDFWPLDNLNTLGGGLRWQLDPHLPEVSLHAGTNRLTADDFQFQQVDEVTPGGVGATTVTTLDRQRLVVSGRVGEEIGDRIRVRGRLYGEVHHLPAGERIDDDGLVEALPDDRGLLLGAEVSCYGWAPDSYVHLFVRHASGLAAVGELTVPEDGFALDGTVTAAADTVAALAFNHDGGPWSVTAAAYLRAFTDADGNTVDDDDGWEWVAAVRPGVYPTRYTSVFVEVSHLALRPNGLNPSTTTFDTPSVTQLSLLPGVQLHPGTFGRPWIHLRYSLVLRDEDAVARGVSSSADPARVQHRLGVGAEWWINSQSYR